MGPLLSFFCQNSTNSVYEAQFYLVHLLRDKLTASKSRIVFVSSGAVTAVSDPSMSVLIEKSHSLLLFS